MISDISKPEERSKTLAFVGMCFALGFTIGPPLGAYLTQVHYIDKVKIGNSVFQTPALFALVLLVIETAFMGRFLPETLQKSKKETKSKKDDHQVTRTKVYALFHCLFLFMFSGVEFTLTFLTFDRFGYTNIQNGT
jgi:MFS family permease